MPNVYITQVPHSTDKDTGARAPTVNITPASEYGETIVMMPPFANFTLTADLVKQLRNYLEKYSYEDGDSVVLLGDPLVIAATCAILGRLHSRFNILRWDRQMKRYFSFSIKP